jgi:hypothetical protein
MATRCSTFGADCVHCGEELIAPERSEHRDERHVLHSWQCSKCGRSFGVISNCLIGPHKHQGRDDKADHHNYDGRASDTELLCPSRWRRVWWRAKTISTQDRQANRADPKG